jgi:hypothetical protein
MSWVARRQGEDAAIPDVQTPAEPDGPVHHQHLAVVSQVHVRMPHGEETLQEFGYPDPTGAEHPGHTRPAVARADTVNQHADLDAAGHRSAERVDEPVGDLAVIEDVGGKRHTLSRAVDGLEHRRVRLIAVQERLDRVSRGKRRLRERGHERGQGSERSCGAFGQGVGRRQECHSLRSPPHPARAPSDPVHAERDVKKGADERREPDQPRPPDRRAHIGLGQDDVCGHHDGEGHVEDEEEDLRDARVHEGWPVELGCHGVTR